MNVYVVTLNNPFSAQPMHSENLRFRIIFALPYMARHQVASPFKIIIRNQIGVRLHLEIKRFHSYVSYANRCHHRLIIAERDGTVNSQLSATVVIQNSIFLLQRLIGGDAYSRAALNQKTIFYMKFSECSALMDSFLSAYVVFLVSSSCYCD